MRNFFRNLSFRTKVLIALMIVNIMLSAFILTYFPQQFKDYGFKSIEDKSSLITEIVASQAAAGLIFMDEDAVRNAVMLATQSDEFLFAQVYDQEFKKCTNIDDQNVEIKISKIKMIKKLEIEKSSDRLIVYHPIKDDQKNQLGVIVLGFSLQDTLHTISRNFQINLIISVVVFVLFFGFAIFLGKMVSSPILNIINRIKDIAQGEGDLTKKIDVNSRDEFGALAHWFNIFVDKLRKIIFQIKVNVEALEGAVTILQKINEDLIMDSQTQNSQVHQIASSIEQITSTIIETSNNANSVSDVTKETTDFAIKGSDIVNTSIKEMESIAGVVNNAAEIIRTLGKSSDEIGEVISVIDNIADQTNLLALNAAIEAARAGDAGRGFSVVADEVRKLAEKTTNATKEIADMITNIQSDTNLAVDSTTKGTEYVERGVASSNEAGTFLSEITNRLNEVSNMITSIAAAANEESSAAEDIAQNVGSITEIVNNSSKIIETLNQSTSQLSDETNSLRSLVGQFILGNVNDLNNDQYSQSPNNTGHDHAFESFNTNSSANDMNNFEKTGLKAVD